MQNQAAIYALEFQWNSNLICGGPPDLITNTTMVNATIPFGALPLSGIRISSNCIRNRIMWLHLCYRSFEALISDCTSPGFCFSSLDQSTTLFASASDSYGYSGDDSSLFPLSANGFSYCKLIASGQGDSVFLKAGSACYQDQYMCNTSSIAVYKGLGCTGNVTKTTLTASLVALAGMNMTASLYNVSKGAAAVLWTTYVPYSNLHLQPYSVTGGLSIFLYCAAFLVLIPNMVFCAWNYYKFRSTRYIFYFLSLLFGFGETIMSVWYYFFIFATPFLYSFENELLQLLYGLGSGLATAINVYNLLNIAVHGRIARIAICIVVGLIYIFFGSSLVLV